MKTPLLRIVESRQQVFVGKREVKLARKEYDILLALAASGITLNREALIEAVWHSAARPPLDTRTVDQHIARLRRKLGKGDFVQTVTCYGYRIAA